MVLAGCGGDKVDDSASKDYGDCGTINLAVNPWVGYEANAAVYAHIAENELGCTVTQKDLAEEVSWQGFESGEVDFIIEDWGHPDLVTKYVDEQKVAESLGSLGVEGLIGWYVPAWMVEEYPDITDWKNLNKYADVFKTSESGDKGQLLDGDPSYISYDQALVQNLNLNYKVVQSGSETATITALQEAQKNKTPLLAYFWDPHWLLKQTDLARVSLPEFTEGCADDTNAVACDYGPTVLTKFARSAWVETDDAGVKLAKAFSWTNDDQSTVQKYIAVDKMSPEDAAKKWVEENPDKVQDLLDQI
jgi:glycine betaine/proline transport system substrate-binding protein